MKKRKKNKLEIKSMLGTGVLIGLAMGLATSRENESIAYQEALAASNSTYTSEVICSGDTYWTYAQEARSNLRENSGINICQSIMVNYLREQHGEELTAGKLFNHPNYTSN